MERRGRSIGRVVLLGVSIAFIGPGSEPVARAGIVGSAHDFSAYAWSGLRICIVCHTPHAADTTVADAPLWNHDVTAATFTLYSSSTLDAAVGQPAGVSKLCLSCHDGTVGVDAYGYDGSQVKIDDLNPDANLGTTLANDHPVSFVYDSALASTDGELLDPAADGDNDANTVGASTPYLPLFNGKLECASCHDVHNTASAGNPKLLIRTNAGSALCLTCHTK